MSKLHILSKRAGLLRWLTIIGMVLLPLAVALSLMTSPLTPATVQVDFPVSPDATQSQLQIALALGLLKLVILLFTLNAMRKLFTAYAAGEVLTDHCALLIQRIGQGFLALAAASFVLRPLQMLVLTMANPPGQRSIAIGVNSEIIFFALSGALIVIIGWAMREASDIATENKSFV
ncbi:hypothetical protein BC777_1942 [Yoonia maricola]|uniref:DUF2975 family protein n=1 Tax=Yoonia maricola TaxID=420999 RepID=A0A2M8WQ91_9RHOB|nr:hypothetical protein [Yoonia maricola]PJI93074.1 hypothetical protein BC777_1942 [Yoonia maricola]